MVLLRSYNVRGFRQFIGGSVSDSGDIAKAGFETIFKPFADLIGKLAGPAAQEIGLTLQDHVRVLRLRRQLRLFKRVKEMLDEAYLEAHRVPLKILGPIIENASVEEDDSLQDRWAALLANAAADRDRIHPSFAEILKQLNSIEVLFLDVLYELAQVDERGCKQYQVIIKMLDRLDWRVASEAEFEGGLKEMKRKIEMSGSEGNLSRLGLVQVTDPGEGDDDTWYSW